MKKFYRHMNKRRADYIRSLYFNKYFRYTETELSEMFMISQSSVSRILSNEVW